LFSCDGWITDHPEAGFDTSSNALAFTVHQLAQRPDIVERMHDEILSVCGYDGAITPDMVDQLEFASTTSA
jgi:hypothetical protein